MSNVIDFKTPAQLRDELAEAQALNATLVSEVMNLKAVKEMLTLQVLDLKDQVNANIAQMQGIINNLDSLLAKLTG